MVNLSYRREQVAELCSEGWTLRAIATLFEVSPSSIARDYHKAGVEITAVQYRLTHRRARVAELCCEGWTLGDIAKHLGVCVRTIHRDRDALDINDHWRPFTEEEMTMAKTLIAEGASIAETARTLGRNVNTIGKRFRGQGWTIHQTGQYNKLKHLRQRLLLDDD